MSNTQSPTAPPAAKDQSTVLIVFGVIQILLGCLCGLMGAILIMTVLLGPLAQPRPGQEINVRTMAPTIIWYLLMTAILIVLGIGSIRARRWAWTLSVVLNWMWLITGILGFFIVVFVMGPMLSSSIEMQSKQPVPAEMLLAIRLITGMIIFIVFILLPAVFLLFYQRASVLATCRLRDPKTRWTDCCPMPVLALCILQAMTFASMLMAPLQGVAMPLFGRYVSGAAGMAVLVLLELALAYLAWGAYRLRMAAWWGTLLLVVVGTVSGSITFFQTNIMEIYEKINVPPAQLELMRKAGFVELMSGYMPWMILAAGAVWVGYLLYIRRYFTRKAAGAPVVSQGQ
jgi:hypothetical protein